MVDLVKNCGHYIFFSQLSLLLLAFLLVLGCKLAGV
jgi:hypothetical protein